MEEAKPVQISKPNSTAADPPPPPPPRILSNKRKLNSVDLRTSPYFKIRALVRQLRPQFIQVLQTPDFRNCKAAHELRIQIKLVMDLYKQMTVEIQPLEKAVLECQTSSGKSMPVKQSWGTEKDGKVAELLQHKRPSEQPAESKTPTYFNSQRKLDDGQSRKSYIVGGSVFGWNFITFGGSSPVYYGRTKESYRNNRKRKMS